MQNIYITDYSSGTGTYTDLIKHILQQTLRCTMPKNNRQFMPLN